MLAALQQGAAGVAAHIGGVPVEEVLMASPGLLAALGGAGAWWRARRSRAGAPLRSAGDGTRRTGALRRR